MFNKILTLSFIEVEGDEKYKKSLFFLLGNMMQAKRFRVF